jgi:hypothetical protein
VPDATSDHEESDPMDAAPAQSSPEVGAGLAERDQEILEFERQWWKYAGAKETAIRESFDMSATRYYQVLNALIDRPEALVADPLLVRRLRRMRAERQRARSARRLGFEV